MALVWFKGLFKKEEPIDSPDIEKQQKKLIVDEYLKHLKKNWKNIEDVLFWKEAWISSGVYAAITVLFWKLISFRLQRLALVTCFVSAACMLEHVRRQLQEKFNFVSKKERKSLSFSYNDVVLFIVDSWIYLELQYEYLMKMKSKSDSKFAAAVGVLVAVPFTILLYIPTIQLLFITVSMLYHWPILNYVGVLDALLAKLKKLGQPALIHWENSQTKRKRACSKPAIVQSPFRRRYSHDSDVEFSLDKSAYNALDHSEQSQESQHNSEDDKFLPKQDRVQFVSTASQDDTASDLDDYLPSEVYQLPSEMPSMSHFDSLMEPLDDEFYKGLNFADFSLRVPANDSDDTDDEVEDLPMDTSTVRRRYTPHATHRRTARVKEPPNSSTPNTFQQDGQPSAIRQGTGQPGADEQDYEFLDQSELDEYSEEELRAAENRLSPEYAIPRDLIGGVVEYSKAGADAVSALLGYSDGKTKDE